MLEIDWGFVEDFTDEGRGSHSSDVPLISIIRSKNINFRSSFMDCSGDKIKDAAYVLLSFYEPTKTIIFYFVNNGNYPGALKLTKNQASRNKSVSISNFLRKFNIDITEAQGSYVAELVRHPAKGDLWSICLTNKLK